MKRCFGFNQRFPHLKLNPYNLLYHFRLFIESSINPHMVGLQYDSIKFKELEREVQFFNNARENRRSTCFYFKMYLNYVHSRLQRSPRLCDSA